MSTKLISHYEILRELGRGGMGVVSLARDTRLGRQVALKVLRPDLVQDPERKQRFIQEARTASSLNHPNIVTIYDIDCAGGVDIIAMEYVSGRCLGEVIGRKGLHAGQALHYAVQIAQALEAAHAAGIVHRDLKPGNIMVSESGLVKVLDFGIAKLTEKDSVEEPFSEFTADAVSPHTADGLVLGTAAYMSPEQATGRRVDARSDIFSFGGVLYEMLTGRRAFAGETNASVVDSILRDDPVRLHDLAPSVPRDLDRIVHRALRKDPNRRFQGMADLRVSLEEVREEYDSGSLRAETLPIAQGARMSPWLLALFFFIVLAGVGFAWWRFLQSGARPAPVLTRVTSNPGLTFFPAVSPDGSLIAYASDRAGNGNLDIWVQQAAGGEPVRLTSYDTDSYEPAFSPDGEHIAFRSDRDGGGVYIVPTLGGEPRLLAREGRSPAFSPDGARLVYAVGSPDASSLYIVPVAGGEPRRLQPDFAVALHPVWTGDGNHVMFVGSRQLDPPGFDWWVAPAGGSGPAIDTQAMETLRARGFELGPYPFALSGGDEVIFSASQGETIDLWRVNLSGSNWRLAGQPQQLTFGAGRALQPSIARSGLLVLSSSSANSDLWSMPIEANQGTVTGPARQLTRDEAADYYPDLATNESAIAFISSRSGTDGVWLFDTASGAQRAVPATPGREMDPKLSADGSILAYSSIENGRPGIFLMPRGAGAPTRLCDNCGLLRDMDRDGARLLIQAGSPPRIGILDVATRQVRTLLEHPKFPLYDPKISPNQEWISFQAVERPIARTIFVAPFRPDEQVPVPEWIQVSDGSAMDRNAVWAPDGKLLYFLSERDGFRCIWAQRLNGATKHPVGQPFAVAHFHNAVRSLMNVDSPAQIGLNIGKDSMIFSMGELTGNIWTTRLTQN